MTQNLIINDTVIEPPHVRLGTNGSVGVDRLSFTFSDGWEGLLTKATFYPPYGSPVEVLTGHEITVPSEMYRNAGSGKMVISGYAIEDNTLVKRKYTLPCVMEVQNTIVRRGANAIPGTESVYEQLRKQMQSDIAEALEEAKNSGDFDGAAATVEVVNTTTLDSDAQAIVENVGTKSAAKLAFGIPRGEKGDSGERGAAGVYVLEDGETAADIPGDANIALFPTGESITLADGRGISTIERTSGDGSAGSLDTYTITYTDNTTSTFSVRNGIDGQIFNVKGVVANTSALPAASAANSGNAYLVGTATPYLLYACVLSGGAYTWLNLGSISGVKGDKGDTGTSITSLTGNAVNKGQGKRAFVLDVGLSNGTSKTFEYDIVDGTNGTNGTNGTDGADGRGIVSIVRTAGTGAAGTTDTYTITYTDKTTSTFSVYNGQDGTGTAVTVDSELSDTSTNPVQNRVIKAALDNVQASGDYVKYTEQTLTEEQKAQARSNIGASDFSGAYGDLTGVPASVVVDKTMTQPGQAADAKEVGDAIDTISNLVSLKANSADIPAWAKAATKPTYTASEVGAVAQAQGDSKAYMTLETNASGNVVLKNRKSSQLTGFSIGTEWSGTSAPYTQKFTYSGIGSTSVIEISLPSTATSEQVEQFNALVLQDGGQTANTFTLKAFGTKNTVSIPIRVIVRRDL
nr:MAG TPA: hypothetical protein [Caudoviricetes sp.]